MLKKKNCNTDSYQELNYGKLCLLTHQQDCVAAACILDCSLLACDVGVCLQEKPSDDSKPWTRFVFNNDALLEEEGAVPSSPGADDSKPVGLGAFDFRPHRAVAKATEPSRSAEQAHEVS